MPFSVNLPTSQRSRTEISEKSSAFFLLFWQVQIFIHLLFWQETWPRCVGISSVCATRAAKCCSWSDVIYCFLFLSRFDPSLFSRCHFFSTISFFLERGVSGVWVDDEPALFVSYCLTHLFGGRGMVDESRAEARRRTGEQGTRPTMSMLRGPQTAGCLEGALLFL